MERLESCFLVITIVLDMVKHDKYISSNSGKTYLLLHWMKVQGDEEADELQRQCFWEVKYYNLYNRRWSV